MYALIGLYYIRTECMLSANSGGTRWGWLADIQNGGVFCKDPSSSYFVRILFSVALKWLKPSIVLTWLLGRGRWSTFSCFSSVTTFCGKKLRVGSTQLNRVALYSSSPGGVSTLLTAQTDPSSSSLDELEVQVRFLVGRAGYFFRTNHPQLENAQKWA